MAKVVIDGREYDTDTLPDEAKTHLTNIQVVDRKIAELKQDMSILQTARNTYGSALQSALPKES